jgi:hypothetical protein
MITFKELLKKVFGVRTRFFEVGNIAGVSKCVFLQSSSMPQREIGHKEIEHLLEKRLLEKYKNRIFVRRLKSRLRKFIVIKFSDFVNVIIPIENVPCEASLFPLPAIEFWKSPALPVGKLFRPSFGSNFFFLESSSESLKAGLRKNINWRYWIRNKSLRDDEMFRAVFIEDTEGRLDIYFLAEIPTKSLLKKQVLDDPSSIEIINVSPN